MRICRDNKLNTAIDDIAFKFLAMHFGIAWGDETKGIPTREITLTKSSIRFSPSAPITIIKICLIILLKPEVLFIS